MAKKFIKVFLLLCISAAPLTGELNNCVKLRAAAFFPSADRMKSIYGQAIPAYEVEGTVAIDDHSFLWVNLDYFHKRGHSDHLKHLTSINMLSFSTGASLIGKVSENLSMYLGAGYSISRTSISNRFTWGHQRETRNISGAVFKSGLLYDFDCRICTELFLDYLFLKRQFHTRVSLGGLKLGLGLGYKF